MKTKVEKTKIGGNEDMERYKVLELLIQLIPLTYGIIVSFLSSSG